MARSLPANDANFRLIAGCEFGPGVIVHAFANLYGCRIGAGTRVGAFVEIQRDAEVGERCKAHAATLRAAAGTSLVRPGRAVA